jgi:hypothetical protein
MTQNVSVRKLHPSELDWANECYSEIDSVHSGESDFLAVAEVDGTKAALGRVVPIGPAVGQLGGIYVLPRFRGRFLSTRIIRFLIENSGFPTLFCIRLALLETFYAQHGFIPVPEQVRVPPEVATRFKWCQKHYSQPVRLMYQINESPNI